MSKDAQLFNLGDKVITKDGTIFVIQSVDISRGRFYYSGNSKSKTVRFPEGNLQLYKQKPDKVKMRVLYAYENLRSGEVTKYTKQKNENQFIVRAPHFDEKWIEE